jgi:ABC-type cobalt transport system substrate-binding protein
MTHVTMVVAVAGITLGLVTASPKAERWEGVDKAVIEKVAEDAGHPADEPLIDTDQGDLLLFLFLLAGAAGGFVAGYAFRGLFPPRTRRAGT